MTKPDIVFFGEGLPERFFTQAESDLPEADLLLVLGTSLAVMPFASLIAEVEEEVPRVLMNREKAGEMGRKEWEKGARRSGFWWGKGARRDVLCLGDCDASVQTLCEKLGWWDELSALMRHGRRELTSFVHAVGATAAAAAAAAARHDNDNDNDDDDDDEDDDEDDDDVVVDPPAGGESSTTRYVHEHPTP